MSEAELKNPLEASDDDFINMRPPSGGDLPKDDPTPEQIAAHNAGDPNGEDDQGDQGKAGEDGGNDAGADDTSGAAAASGADGVVPEAKPTDGAEAGKDSGKSEDGTDPNAEKPAAVDGEVKTFTVPIKFKANGKDIELKSEQEAISLMQMGANYTRKMQELQPHRKMLMMLQNNGLLDESELSFLIDVKKGDKEALKKLIKDSGIDPLDIDVSVEPNYQPGSHAVSDDEERFRTAIIDLRSDPAGNETVTHINTEWDDASKEALWKAPEIMAVIHEQRQNGVYKTISAEVDRRRTLGIIPANTPFLQAYKAVGDEMVEATLGKQPDQANKEAKGEEDGKPGADGGAGKTPAEPIATRTATPKSTVANGDKASAASPSRSTPAAAAAAPSNPLAMSDEAFLKQMEGRV
jgi:hypothetical protein